MVSSVLSVLAVAVGLGFVIFVHELGHFAVAKWVGVVVERFSIGFGPVLWSFRRGETEYAFSAIPFGGYVKMLGQDDAHPSEMVNESIRANPRSYPAQSVPRRMAIISAGVVMNIIFGFLFFLLVFNLGVSYTPPVLGYVEPGGPAWKAGLERGDEIRKIDGKELMMREFEVFHQKVLLSDDLKKGIDVEVARGAERLSFHIVPRMGRLGPEIGVLPSLELTLIPKSPVAAGSAASRAKGAQFQPGDRITHVNDQAVRSYPEFADFLARHAHEDVRVRVRRAARNGTDGETAEIELPPQTLRDLGLRLQMGKITAIRAGSPAERAGFEVGDVIQSVDSESVDPFRLPNKLTNQAGRDVEIQVKRQSHGEEFLKLTVCPDPDKPAWVSPPRVRSPLTVPALGIAYQLVPAITEEPDPSSPAGLAGLHKGDRIRGAILIEPVDADGKKPREIELQIDDEHPSLPSLFWELQQSPQAEVKFKVKRGDETITSEAFSPLPDPNWFAPFRGIALVSPLTERLEPQGFTRSLVLGYETTRYTLVTIYLSLRGLLISRTISPELVGGPISIAVTGYHAATTDVMTLMKFLAMLSINLAVINFLPIPVLDGGHMLFLTWEWIRGKPASERVLVTANYCGLVLILALVLLVTGHDIWRLISDRAL